MKKCLLIAFPVLLASASIDADAWGSLQSQKVDGFSRYCTYTDGGVITIGSTELCPVDNSKGAQNNGSPSITIEKKNVGFGSLTDQKVNGFSRYCSYSNGAVLTVGSTDPCPVTDQIK